MPTPVPVDAISPVFTVLKIFWDTYNNFQLNMAQCQMLYEYAHGRLDAVQRECDQQGHEFPQKRFARFIEYVCPLFLDQSELIGMLQADAKPYCQDYGSQ